MPARRCAPSPRAARRRRRRARRRLPRRGRRGHASDWRERLRARTSRPDAGRGADARRSASVSLNEQARPGDTVIAAAGEPARRPAQMWDATGGGTATWSSATRAWATSSRPPRRPAGAADGRGLRLHRRRHVPDEPDRARHRRAGGPQVTVLLSDNHGLPVIRRLQLAAVGRKLRQRVPRPRRRLESPRGRLPARSTSPRTPRASAPAPGTSTTADEFAQALREARAETRSCVIVVDHRDARLRARLGGLVGCRAGRGHRLTTRRARLRDDYEQGRGSRQRYYG